MAIAVRTVKRRIKSIRSTSKIMKAMELVASSKMRKASQLTLAARPYARTLGEMVGRVRRLVDPARHPLLAGWPVSATRRTLVIVAASDRGLCGAFNNQILKKTLEFIRARSSDSIRIVTVGRRAEQAVKRAGYELLAAFPAISNAPSFERSAPVGELVAREFLEQRSERVFLAYTDFKSTLVQQPKVEQLLPLVPEEEMGTTPSLVLQRSTGPSLRQSSEPEESKASFEERRDDENEEGEELDDGRLFEPSAGVILEKLLPRMVELSIYQALLESSASEHAARMMAMRSAADAAGEMLDSLTLALNQARQGTITKEISEISAGTAAQE